MRRVAFWIAVVVFALVLTGTGALVIRKLNAGPEEVAAAREQRPVPVEVAAVEVGPIEERRVFSGTLEATARLTVAPKVPGRVASLPLEIADVVERGQVVARLDSDEFAQAVAQAEAELAVERAGLAEAESEAGIATREYERVTALHERGIASDSQLDTARAAEASRGAAVKVAEARVLRAEAALASARIRLGYASITADWEGGDGQRVVAERYAEQGDTVSANTPLLAIIELDPIRAVIFVTERDYALLEAGQAVRLETDAYPGRVLRGEVARVAPVFREGSRQARVEIRVANEDAALKPGMFVRVGAVLDRVSDATLVPARALVRRDERDLVFVLDGEDSVRAVEVSLGIRDGETQQVEGEGLGGGAARVVTLGQQLLEDGSAVRVVDADGAEMTTAEGDGAGAAGAAGGVGDG